MLKYYQSDNTKSVEITVSGHISTEEFDDVAAQLEAFIQRHKDVRVLENIESFSGMDPRAFWHDLQFSLRHLRDFSRCAIVCEAKIIDLWSELIAPFSHCQVRHFLPDEIEQARAWLQAGDSST